MKKKLLFFMLLLFALKCFSETKKLMTLNSEEYFSLEYSKGILEVYKTSNNDKELYFKATTPWGTYQLSQDKKQLLVYSRDDKMFYLLDGNEGSYKPLTKKRQSSRTSFDLKYIIWQKDLDSKEDRTKTPRIVITRLADNKDLYEISWEELKSDYKYDYSFGYLFIRSDDPDYDFYVYAKGEGEDHNFGMMKINVEKRIIKKEQFYGKTVKIPDYPSEYYGF